MSTSLMVSNGKGWERVAKTGHCTLGHASDGYGLKIGSSTVCLEVGTSILARTGKAKKAINRAFLDAGWVAHTAMNTRTHESGAVVEIDRWCTAQDGTPVRARFTRVR